MQGCRRLVEVGRRQFLKGSGSMAAGAVAASVAGATRAKATPAPARVDYPSNRLANVSDLAVNEPLDIAYPGPDSPGVLLKLGQAAEGGVGPDGDIVGFSTMCPHKGYGLLYDPSDRVFNCPGHFSRFDPEKGGLQIWGQATQNLPQFQLRVDDRGDIYAEGVDELIYGRLSNVL
jgi:arsenite oxidase small subunit